jgi:autoinducer 2 (AI-2) kinase
MALTEAYLVIDIGTGNARVAIAAMDGKILAIEREDVRYERDDLYPESIYFEPGLLWEQITRLTERALQQVPGLRLTAVTATSQREGIVLLGRAGESLIGLPNIDHRGREWEGEIADKGRIYKLTGRYPGSLFSACKLAGIRGRRQDLWRQLSTFLSISDWVQYKLSGIVRYEHSQASETLLYDVAEKSWSDELCAAFDIDPSLPPVLQSSGTVLGPVLPEYAGKWSFAPGALVVVGGGDTQLAIASVMPSVDDLVIVSGTTTPIIKLIDKYVLDARQRTWTSRYTDENQFVLEANAGVTGLNYQRLKEIFYPNESYEVIESELEGLSCSQCVASLGSLIADEQSPVVRGGFFFNVPVSHQLNRASFVWATLWDIACSIRENYKTLCAVAGHEQSYIWACGGGMQSRTLRQMIANLLGKRVQMRDNFKQSSVIGGVYCCNKALHRAHSSAVVPDIVDPDGREDLAPQFEAWKRTRGALRQIVNEL